MEVLYPEAVQPGTATHSYGSPIPAGQPAPFRGRRAAGRGGAPEGRSGSGPRGAMESLWRLKRFDAFPKTLEDFRVKTCGGALGERASGRAGAAGGAGGGAGADGASRVPAVTVVSGLIMVLLFFSELQYYLTKEVSGGERAGKGLRVCLPLHSGSLFFSRSIPSCTLTNRGEIS